jgi:hypothetical protein
MRQFNRACRGRVRRLQTGDDLAGRKDLDLEIAVRRLIDELRHRLGRAVDRVERLGKRRGAAPGDFWH